MNWQSLQSSTQLADITTESAHQPVLIFKHSTRCNISRATLDRLERNWKDETAPAKLYFLDLLSYRQVSDQIAQQFGVEHESPQVLIIKNGKAIFHRSHFDIDYASIREVLNQGAVKN